MHRGRIEGSREGNVFVSSTKPFERQELGEMVVSGSENAKPRKCRQKRRKTRLRGFYYRLFFRGNEVADCALLGK